MRRHLRGGPHDGTVLEGEPVRAIIYHGFIYDLLDHDDEAAEYVYNPKPRRRW